jgi:hypothetical protein
MNFDLPTDFRCVDGFVFFDLKAQNLCIAATTSLLALEMTTRPHLHSLQTCT